jgi:hypothetical protein
MIDTFFFFVAIASSKTWRFGICGHGIADVALMQARKRGRDGSWPGLVKFQSQ